MYTCHLCNKPFPYLILEYDTTVCERCSIKKNIRNTEEIEALSDDISEEEGEIEVQLIVEDHEVEELFKIIEKIENPQIREDFMEFAEQYLEDY